MKKILAALFIALTLPIVGALVGIGVIAEFSLMWIEVGRKSCDQFMNGVCNWWGIK